MPIYRLAEGVNPDGLPFLFEGHAYLADGTPLTRSDRYGRVTPAEETLAFTKATCSGGLIGLADRRSGIAALARALDKGDVVRAPLLLLFLQIDADPAVAKYNPFHKPRGPGGGQFASGQGAGSSSDLPPGFQQVAQTLNVGVTSDYKKGIYGAELDKAHSTALLMVWIATMAVTRLDFKPGMPDYGQELDKALRLLIATGDFPGFTAQPVYLGGSFLSNQLKLPSGCSVPDFVYGPASHPLMIFELKSGRAALNLNDSEIVEQKRRTLSNVPDDPVYQYLQVYEK